MAYDHNNTQAIGANLAKARKAWARVSRVLRAENASPKVCGVFYKEIIQAVLLIGSETWNLAPSGLKCLEGFHLQAAWQMSGKQPMKRLDGTRRYPNSEQVLREVGLQTISHYIGVCRQHVASFIVNRPIFQICQEGLRRRGFSACQFWWEQPLDLETAGLAAMAADKEGVSDDGD